MITRIQLTSLFISFFSIPYTSSAFSQCIITSNDGYEVHVSLYLNQVVSQSSCEWGYNYNVEVAYDVKLVGQNIPSSLYTLQGFLKCGDTQTFFDMNNAGGEGITFTSTAWTPRTDCNSVIPADLECFTAKVIIQGPGLPYQEIECLAFGPLPIELQSFHVMELNDEVAISWTTASETNNDFFTVQRSTDGQNWKNLLHQNGAGNSSVPQHYYATDSQPVSGIAYYRLKQTDFNGEVSFSEIKVITLELDSNLPPRVFPNPTNDILFIEGSEFVISNIRVYSIMGRDVTNYTEVLGSGNHQLILITRHLEKGNYVLRAGAKSIRFSKI